LAIAIKRPRLSAVFFLRIQLNFLSNLAAISEALQYTTIFHRRVKIFENFYIRLTGGFRVNPLQLLSAEPASIALLLQTAQQIAYSNEV